MAAAPTTDPVAAHRHLVGRLRRALLGVTAAVTVGTAVELAMLRHWDGALQLVPWVALAVLGGATAALAWRRTAGTVLTARVVGGLAALSGAFGAVEHVQRNYESGPLDFRYEHTWSTMGVAHRWWLAASGGVGPSPALAPAILALAGACLALATLAVVDDPPADPDPAADPAADADPARGDVPVLGRVR